MDHNSVGRVVRGLELYSNYWYDLVAGFLKAKLRPIFAIHSTTSNTFASLLGET